MVGLSNESDPIDVAKLGATLIIVFTFSYNG